MAHTCLCENNGDDQKYYVSNNKSLGQLGHVQPDVKYSTSCRENNDGSHYRAADLNLELAQPFGQMIGNFHVNAQMIATARVVMIRERFPRMLTDKPEMMHTTAITYRMPRSTTGVLNFGWR